MAGILESPLLGSALAKQTKFGQAVEECVQKGKSLLEATKFVLVANCPKLAALHEVTATDSDVKRYADFLDHAGGFFHGLGLDETLVRTFLLAFAPKMQALLQARGSTVFDHVRKTVDIAIDSLGTSGLTEPAVKDLLKRMPQQGSAYVNFITDLLMSRVLIDQVEAGFNAKIASSILAHLDKAKTWIAEHGDDAAVFFEKERFARIVSFLEEKTTVAAASVREARDSHLSMLIATGQEICQFADKQFPNSSDFCEESFMRTMRAESKAFADKQRDMEKLVAQLVTLFGSIGEDFLEQPSYDESQQAIGIVVYIVALYTAITLYRSPLLGKKTAAGEKTLQNLKQVLDAINVTPCALELDYKLDLKLVEEMRGYAAVKRAERKELQHQQPQQQQQTSPGTAIGKFSDDQCAANAVPIAQPAGPTASTDSKQAREHEPLDQDDAPAAAPCAANTSSITQPPPANEPPAKRARKQRKAAAIPAKRARNSATVKAPTAATPAAGRKIKKKRGEATEDKEEPPQRRTPTGVGNRRKVGADTDTGIGEAGNTQQTPNKKDRTTNNKQHTTNDKQRTTTQPKHNKEQITNDKQRSTNNEQQSTNNKMQTTSNEERTTHTEAPHAAPATPEQIPLKADSAQPAQASSPFPTLVDLFKRAP